MLRTKIQEILWKNSRDFVEKFKRFYRKIQEILWKNSRDFTEKFKRIQILFQEIKKIAIIEKDVVKWHKSYYVVSPPENGEVVLPKLMI